MREAVVVCSSHGRLYTEAGSDVLDDALDEDEGGTQSTLGRSATKVEGE